jgi:D-threo-aldose 1-dehydrogenase
MADHGIELTPNRVPGPLGFGCANLGNLYRAMSDEDAHAVLDAAWNAGIRHFDTAPHYGLGLSERRLGAFLAGKPRAEYVLSTKVGRLLRPTRERVDRRDDAHGFVVPATFERVWDSSRDGIRRSLDESLGRLGLDRVDVLYLHDPDQADTDLDRALSTGLPALAGLREAGVVRAVGVGSTSTTALLAAARTGLADLLMVAGRYTLLEQPAGAELLPECRARDIGVVIAGVFNSGLLATATPQPGAHYDYAAAQPEVLEQARQLGKACARHGVQLPVAALQFPLREPAVRAVVLGGSRPEQVVENVARLRVPVPEALWDDLVAEGMIRS